MVKIVAELSGCHGGSLDNCMRLIEEAKKLKVDAIKFQVFDPPALAEKRQHLFPDTDLLALYKQTYTPRDWWPELRDALGGYAWGASVFSQSDLWFVMGLQPNFLKIASFELTDLDLIRDCAATHLPLVISVGRSANSINSALAASEGSRKRSFLMATPYENHQPQRDQKRLDWLKIVVPPVNDIGVSDHYPPNDTVIWPDIDMIERHLCLPDVATPDTPFSSNSSQFKTYINAVRAARGGRGYARGLAP